MSKHVSDFVGKMAQLAGMDQAKRVDRQNLLVFKHELKGSTEFDKIPGEKDRLAVFFRGFPDTYRSLHVQELARLMELFHYIHEGKADDEEVAEAVELENQLTAQESQYPDIVEVMSVADAKVAAGWWD